ncbi:unnamed protein product [Adineta steineri]|uniref:Methyltransferase type 11 domain-containing protein n=1 Tax=Adineta steineri TaxID=433720 RepID=A0A814YT57_9BILA|nr:unnamed protein product [Adineta steineri]CAF3646593.1 unnamed protein product [Adineta steineri]
MAQNIYDNQDFFDGYAQLNRSVHGLNGAPEWPSIVRMLSKMDMLDVVDLGCGYGWFCRYARENGAKHVLGLDISQKMLNKAKQMTSDSEITYRQEDLEQVELPTNTYDLVYSSLTLHYIENLSTLLKTIYQSLTSGGYFIFSAEHPIYTAPTNPDWIVDKDGHKSWPVNSYQAEGHRRTNWLTEGVLKQHRMIGTYLNLLIGQGFTIQHVEEWGPTPQQIIENPSLDEEKERPMLFLVSVQKSNNK